MSSCRAASLIQKLVFLVTLCGLAWAAAAEDYIIFSHVDTTLRDYGYVKPNLVWSSLPVKVCWENPNAQNAAGRLQVEKAIEGTWAAKSGVKFTGWKACSGSGNSGIRILVSDETMGPHSEGVGRQLDGRVDGMRLNFTFQKWGTEHCGTRHMECVWNIAVHEFGHAIGFLHESIRPDAPADCKARKDVLDDPSKVEAGVEATYYDPDSVMNYCSEYWNNNGQLSDLDVKAAKVLYPLPNG